MKFLVSLATWSSLLSATSSSAAGMSQTSNGGDIDYTPLGSNSLDVVDYEYDVVVDDSCQYQLTATFTHQPDFPVGTADTCRPGVDAPEDGLPILVGRWRWERYPKHVREATGVDHLSLDYNPCGHPGPGFLTPHYDIHFYRVTPEYRATKMNCVMVPGTPACLPDGQDTPEGNAFYSVAKSTRTGNLTNMPPNYSAHVPDAVINMGMHAWNNDQEPKTPEEWIDPIYVLVTHDSQIVAVEPMVPYHYTFGTESHFWEESVTYVEQTISTLPYHYSVEYNADTGETTTIMTGQSALCKDEFAEAALLGDDDEGGSNTNGGGGSTSGSTTSTTTTSTIVSVVVASVTMMMTMTIL